MLIFKLIFWAGTVVQILIRAPYAISVRSRKKTEQHGSRTEKVLLTLLTIAAGILPLFYTLTNWLAFVNYGLPAWLGWIGVFILIGSLLIFWRAHADLKSNWSPSFELYEGRSYHGWAV